MERVGEKTSFKFWTKSKIPQKVKVQIQFEL